MSTRRRFLIGSTALALGGRALAEAAPAPWRGVIVSCPMYGQIWGSHAMASALDEIKALGADAVQIHPYARVRTDGAVQWSKAADTGYLDRCAEIARQKGVRLFVKPHLAYWGSFSWRGAITFAHEAQWARFFRGYSQFIVDQARFAQRHQVPLFALGTELEGTVHRREWPGIVAAVRQTYRGTLTYAANWDKLSRVPFWSQLDLIGVQAYFPVARHLGASVADIERGWGPHLKTMQSLSARHGKRVLFAEVGYARGKKAGHEPWVPDTDGDDAVIAYRARLMRAALGLLPRQRWFAGMFWWKWIPGPSLWDRDFSMKNDEAQQALRAAWSRP